MTIIISHVYGYTVVDRRPRPLSWKDEFLDALTGKTFEAVDTVPIDAFDLAAPGLFEQCVAEWAEELEN